MRTTLEQTLHADGTNEHRVAGVSAFPRHWVYDGDGLLIEKVALTDSTSWLHTRTDQENPWQGVDAPAVTLRAEGELERRLSTQVLGRRPDIRRDAGEARLPAGKPRLRRRAPARRRPRGASRRRTSPRSARE